VPRWLKLKCAYLSAMCTYVNACVCVCACVRVFLYAYARISVISGDLPVKSRLCKARCLCATRICMCDICCVHIHTYIISTYIYTHTRGRTWIVTIESPFLRRLGEARCLCALGYVLFLQKDRHRCISHYEVALKIFEANGMGLYMHQTNSEIVGENCA
jgi:hypothetical protein